jgi:two-component system chemotaxis response regulator CheY
MPERKPLAFADLTVLLAEDDAFSRKLVLSSLTRLGVTRVTAVSNGVEALQAIADAKAPFDLIISDWNMPQMTGLDLLRLVRSEHPAMPFLMLTGNATIDLVKAARSQNVDGYVIKPFSVEQLKTKIGAIFGFRG